MGESLLKKYDIPINHLDFDYIKTCENVKEIERIVHVLKSGEEGYYPDLTNCALAKLRSLKPNSKIFREEVPVLNKRTIPADEWTGITSDIDGWTETIKKQNNILHKEKPSLERSIDQPIRQFSSENSSETDTKHEPVKRIKSCDYAKWDKYDPDVEIVKMDLKDERECETVKIKNKKKLCSVVPTNIHELVDKLSVTETQDLANKHRIKGNEFYKTGDFDEAIHEYTLSIQIFPTASAFNNRAITYLKMNNQDMAISDCNQCLNLEPNNIKASQRKAQALINLLKHREAYQECEKILSIDSNNQWAKKKVSEMKLKIVDLPPVNAFRMKIEEKEPDAQNKRQPRTEDEFADLIIPKKIVPSKLSKLKSKFVLNKNVSEKNKEKPQCSDYGSEFIIPSTQPIPKITEYCNGVVIEEL